MKAAAEAKSPKQVPLGLAKQPVLQSAEAIRSSGRNLLLAYFGLLAAFSDNLLTAYRQGAGLVTVAQVRGERMERAVSRRLKCVADVSADDPEPAPPAVADEILHRRPSAPAGEDAAHDNLEQQVRVALANLGIPSRERLERLGQEIECLTEKIDEELRKSDAAAPARMAM